ncbi:MAG: family 43 glycosylhydrolase [Clostridiales bacterium]|nr:family 43 glycosylhydrolase [Clostridiales bacterium]
MIIESGLTNSLRDPFVLLENGTYYMYGTGWSCCVNPTGRLDSGWEAPVKVVETPADCAGDMWAPEVYALDGAYYMFTTYRSAATGHRGCSVFKASSPLGPFVEISDGHATPHDWDSIDGTLYIDENKQKWMIFVHEWTCTDDGIGRMACAKLSDDLTHFISEPVELFRADDPSWSSNRVTDGCYMYKSSNGSLYMIWSNWDDEGYCVGVAESKSGQVTGPWTHIDERLYSKSVTGVYDGGHGMIFTGTDGKMYLSIHSPNNASSERCSMPIFVEICEDSNGRLTRA